MNGLCTKKMHLAVFMVWFVYRVHNVCTSLAVTCKETGVPIYKLQLPELGYIWVVTQCYLVKFYLSVMFYDANWKS